MATPLLAELRRLYPNARIDLLATPDSAELLATNPHATRVIADKYVKTQSNQDYRAGIQDIRNAGYSACLMPLTAVDYWYVVRVALARVGTRVIHDYNLHPANRFTTLCTHRIPFDQTRHDVESNLDMLRALTRADVKAGPLVLPLPEGKVEETRNKLVEMGWRDERATVAFCPGSTLRWSHKRWPDEQYIELATRLLGDRSDTQVAVFCGPDEAESAALFRQRFRGEPLVVIEGLPLLTYAAALSLCQAVVTGDSLPLHMSAALQVPQVALFGPTDPRRTGPWQAPAKVLVPDCDYVPFYRIPYPPDPSKYPPCMPLITVDEVEQALAGLMTCATPKPAS
ncbi:MAG: glycosyltransferase family 9 protein [FCB group bacterium]|jgi:ADP-heptose:LPS heptosyltransferase|nr:glycosyltransferase family 9 protein [FCB group bacterium]